MSWLLIFAVVLFLLGLAIVIDDFRFKRKARIVVARVLSVERVESNLFRGHQPSTGLGEGSRHVAWKTRFEFEADGRSYTDEDEIGWEPGTTLSVWYARDNPLKARVVKSKVAYGWNLLATSLIPFGFWALDAFEILQLN